MTFLTDTLILLCAAVLVVPLFQYLRLGMVLGFLAAGMLIGPAGLGLITEVKDIRSFAELGVVFLLFIIGIELKPARLWLMRRMVFGLGTAQVVVSAVLIGGLLYVLGVAMSPAVILGLGLALSSTAFVLQLLTEQRALNTAYGRHAFAVLLLQDLAVVPLLALVPLLARPEASLGSNIGVAILQTAGVLAVVIFAGRYLLRPVLHRIASYSPPEIFLATTLLLVLGAATLVEHAGMSMAMGAFLAGLLIADSEFRHQILADIQPFRGILLGLFFMSVGMTVDLGRLTAEPLLILGLLLLLLGIKAGVMYGLARGFGVNAASSLRLAPLMAQGGEFGFVLFGVAFQQGLLGDDIYQQAIMVIALSMAVTPLLVALGQRLGGVVGEAEPLPVMHEGHGHAESEVIIAGFGRVGMRIAKLLRDAGIPYVAIEHRPRLVSSGREDGYAVFYGDAVRPEVLRAAGAEHARVMVVAIDNADAVEQLVREAHRLYPHLTIYARAHSRRRCEYLLRIGASKVVSDNLETSLQLARFTLLDAGMDEEQVSRQLLDYRDNYYEYLGELDDNE